jgi:hypothetical protein
MRDTARHAHAHRHDGPTRKARADALRSTAARAVVGQITVRRVNMATKAKNTQPSGNADIFASRIWHWRLKKYIYATDYGIKAFPIRNGRKH